MNKIGFQNFRRFKNFKPLEYKGITFLVGRNNSGKSTMVKSLLLVYEYFKLGKINQFSFINNILEDANIVTYDRALYNSSSVNQITFLYQFKEFEGEIWITGEADATEGSVKLLSINDLSRNIRFSIDLAISEMTITKTRSIVNDSVSQQKQILINLDKEIQEIENRLRSSEADKSPKMYLNLVDELNNIKERRKRVSDFRDDDKITSGYKVVTYIPNSLNFNDVIASGIDNILADHDFDFVKAQEGKETSKNFDDTRAFKFGISSVEESIREFSKVIANQSIIYLGANPSKQSAIYSIRDKNNALAQAIHNFVSANQYSSDEGTQFLIHWMKKFNIGASIKINLHAGEAYEVLIHSNGKDVQLADMGMGSIQIMLLIFRLASIIGSIKKSEHEILVIIEEPELNLHPALQSKLADFFLEVFDKYQINFIIETHSEYLIRETQHIVKEKEFEVKPNENPFCVIYFDSEKRWNMNYRADGVFIEDFGDGFFNVSSQQAIKLFSKNTSQNG